MKLSSERDIQWGALAGTAALGAVAMYLFDPDRGRDRRERSSRKLLGIRSKTSTALDHAMHGIGERLSGVRERVSHLNARSSHASSADERSLVEHVRAELGNAVSNPMALSIDAQDGNITINGLVLENERRAMLKAIKSVSGVREVIDRTETLERPDDSTAMRQLMAPLAEAQHWSPAARNAALVGGGALGVYGMLRRSPLAMLLGLAGVAMLARGMGPGARSTPAQLGSTGSKAQTVSFEKTIRIDASPEQVYDFWSNYENFPQFMSYVSEVRDLGRQRSHWIVKGPGGTEYQWNAVLTEQTRPRRLAWRSEPGAEVENAGSVEFEPSRGGTRATVRMSYKPPVGKLGQVLAKLLGNDPQRELEDDLARMKSAIERGTGQRDMTQPASSSSGFLH